MTKAEPAIERAYGWRPSPPDFRDIRFAFQPPPLLTLPPRVDLTEGWDQEPFDPVFAQGSLGSCGPQTAAADIIFAILRQQGGASSPMPSRLFIYYFTRLLQGTVNEDSGVSNRDLLKALNKYGWCDEALHPHVIENFRQRPSSEAIAQASTRRIVEYKAVAQQLETLKACLAGGDPFILGFSVYSSIESAAVDATGDIPLPQLSERQLGGHDVLAVGYDDSTARFKIRNSWGRRWGRDGYGTLPYGYVTSNQLAGDFWTVKHGGYLPAPVPPPAPPSPPVPPEPVPVPPSPPVHREIVLRRGDTLLAKVE